MFLGLTNEVGLRFVDSFSRIVSVFFVMDVLSSECECGFEFVLIVLFVVFYINLEHLVVFWKAVQKSFEVLKLFVSIVFNVFFESISEMFEMELEFHGEGS